MGSFDCAWRPLCGRHASLRMTSLLGFLPFFVWDVAFGIIGVNAGVDGEWGIEEVPSFAVFFQAHLFCDAVGVEAEHGLGGADFDGNDVPDVEGDDVGGDEIDVALGVDGAALAVSPGLGDGEAALAGLVEESGFGTFSGALGVGTVGVVGLARVEATLAHWELLREARKKAEPG